MQNCIEGIGVDLAILVRVELVERRADEQVRALGLPGMGLGQKDGGGPEVVAADLRWAERLGHAHVGVADDREAVPERLQRLERVVGQQLEIGPDGGRRETGAGSRPTRCSRPNPWTSSMHTRRVTSVAAVTVRANRPAGAIASRNGSATVAPIPRRNVRRGRCFPVMNDMVCPLAIRAGSCVTLRVSAGTRSLPTTPMMNDAIR